MLLLALETATEAASVALLRDGELLAASDLPADRPASEALLPAILELLAAHALEPVSLDAFAVSIGPGSFTGLRVGVATAKGLAFGAGRCVAPVPTLAALAATQGRGCVAAVLDARRGELYAAAHRAEDPLAEPLWGPCVLGPAELAARVGAGWRVVGAAVPGVAQALRARFGEAVALAGPSRPDAVTVGRLGARLLEGGHGVAAAELAPRYVRRAEAEVRRTGAATDFDTPRRLS